MTLIRRKSKTYSLTTAGVILLASALLLGCIEGDQQPDTIVDDYVIAYVKRPILLNNEGEVRQPDFRRLATFNQGGDLYVKERASPSANETNITHALTGGMGDVKDVEVSYDGSKILFSLRMPEIEDADDDEQPTWNIWEYDVASKQLRRVIDSDIISEEGQDIAPHYLPDGRIIFASTRQRQSKAILLDEGKPQFSGLEESRREEAFVLHVMNSDGSDIHQVTFNQSHDTDPVVLANGRVLFSRWHNTGGRSQYDLYDMNPDGTDVKLLYGAHSHSTGTDNQAVQFLKPREMADGRLVVLLSEFNGTDGGGRLTAIDVNNFADHDKALLFGVGESGQTALVDEAISTSDVLTAAGRYGSAYPFWDGTGRMLVTWTPCRLIDNDKIIPCTEPLLTNPDAEQAHPLYGAYIYDPATNTQLPVVVPQEEVIISDVVAAQPRTLPTTIFDKTVGAGLDTTLAEQGVGVLHIRSVYDFDGSYNALGGSATNLGQLADPMQTTAQDRPARFLRLVKGVAIPDRDVYDFDNSAFGRSAQNLMREILGYTMIEPDGSVKVKVPANVPFYIDVLDADGRRIGAPHRGWLQLKAGESVECQGCHTHTSNTPHGGPVVSNAINQGATTTGVLFPNTATQWIPQAGETMAQTRARISCDTDCAVIEPRLDVMFDDVWTNENQRAKDASINLRYADLTTPAPAVGSCITQWQPSCRTTINYETHIHPLWSKERITYDVDGITVLADHTCTSCHTNVDAMQNARVPDAQLDLTDGASDQDADHYKAYRELLFNDDEQEVIENLLVDIQIQARDGQGNLLYEVDGNGQLILDGAGDPIPVMVTIDAQGPSMSTQGAASSYFFDLFAAGGSHEGWLTAAELRLLSEWLDIGGQYYNNPFAAPEN